MRRPLDPQGGFVIEEPPVGLFEVQLSHPHLRVTETVETRIVEGSHTDLGEISASLAASLLVLVSDDQGQPVANASLQQLVDGD